ncbi:hypothetical protein BGZ83_002345 [Gryganskiella cystojenkinii]|nr:hypothetical protein BGZ83_002345 [Gryganskiella cystojenkinii]
MASTEPLRPFCFAATSKGVVYAASFAYLDINEYRFEIDHERNYFVILKGVPALGSAPSNDQDNNINDGLLTWTAVTATERTNAIVDAEAIPVSGLSCGVTEDETRFMLHTRPDDSSSQSSTIQVLLSETLYNASNSNNSGPFARIQTALDQRGTGPSYESSWRYKPYWTLTPVQDLMQSNSTSTLAASSRQPYGDWIQFSSDGGVIQYKKSVNGSFPLQTQGTLELYNEEKASTLFRINLETRSFSQASIQFSKNTNRQKFSFAMSGNSWRLMSISESMLLLAYRSMENGSNLYSINVETGFLDTYTLNYIPHFHPNNPNPDMSRSPLTLSDFESVLITVAALALALLLIWIQNQALKMMRRWKGEVWFEEDDIPGSKLAEEMDEETFQAYQRQEQERIQRHLRENGDQIENEHRIYHDVAVSTSFETTNVHRRSPLNNNNVNTSSSSRVVLTQELPASSPLFRADGLEQLGFSSHPRPNVVTTIPDDGSEE